MDSREAMIKVAEQRVDQKIKEMEILRAQLQTMVSQADAAQQTQIENLVKIYETMKPKEAARIFEALDMHVLLGVVQRMKPARTAAVMAEMAPEKAKEITVALTKQDQLPQIK
jgi:flagellar motility protein MotE (MotC chaperone)